jgi:hypothetical protein
MIAVCLTDDCDGTGCACDCHDGDWSDWLASDERDHDDEEATA